MRAVSKKRAALQRARRKLIASMGEPMCAVGCGRKADDLHELLSRARGGSITDPENVRAVCRGCHDYITRNPAWAEANGWSVKRW